jgi:hypothetical protein
MNPYLTLILFLSFNVYAYANQYTSYNQESPLIEDHEPAHKEIVHRENISTECGRNNVDSDNTESLNKSLEYSLWTFRSSAWNGYIDFQGFGRYWTHWGYGHWSVDNNGNINLVNDYDAYTHQLTISKDGKSLKGSRNDGIEITGKLICGQYYGNIPTEPQLDGPKSKITKFYQDLLGRQPDPAGLQYWLGLYQDGQSLEDIKQGIMNSTEYRSRFHEVKDVHRTHEDSDFITNKISY